MNEGITLVRFNGVTICNLENDSTGFTKLTIRHYWRKFGLGGGASQILTFEYARKASSGLSAHEVRICEIQFLEVCCTVPPLALILDTAALLFYKHGIDRNMSALPIYAPSRP